MMMMIHLIEWKVFDWFDNAALLISRKKGLIQSNRSRTDDQRAIPWSFSVWFGKRFSIFYSFIKSTHREVYLIWSFKTRIAHIHYFNTHWCGGYYAAVKRNRIYENGAFLFVYDFITAAQLYYAVKFIQENIRNSHQCFTKATHVRAKRRNKLHILNEYGNIAESIRHCNFHLTKKNSYFNVNCFGNMYWRRRCYFKSIRYSLFADSTTWITHVFMVSGFNLNRMQLRSHMLSN